MANHYAGFDTTGQNPPPGMKPRVTATLWEDEGSLCFQVEARGICVARREGMMLKKGRRAWRAWRVEVVSSPVVVIVSIDMDHGLIFLSPTQITT